MYDTIKEFIVKLQQLPEGQKKVIFFTILIVSALIMGFFAVESTKKDISKIEQSIKSVNVPSLNAPSPKEDLFNPTINDVHPNRSGDNLETQNLDVKPEQ